HRVGAEGEQRQQITRSGIAADQTVDARRSHRALWAGARPWRRRSRAGAGGGVMKISTILCPTDFSEPSRHAMEHAIGIARWSGARVIPLHVEAPAHAAVPVLVGGGPEARPAGTRLAFSSSPAEGIAEFAASSKVDLIVIGTHGVGGFRHLILGSVTETVL